MLRAEAATFVPSGFGSLMGYGEDVKGFNAYVDDCSTAEPSPALTACYSPYWTMPEMSDWSTEADEFVLPEAEDSSSEQATFSLAGLDDLTSVVQGLLSAAIPKEASALECSKSELPEGLELPPGLEDVVRAPLTPPGLGPEDADEPQMLTVAELHDHFNKSPASIPEETVEATAAEEEAQLPDLPEGTTTVMLRNIPNKYTQEMLMEKLNTGGFRGDIDFIYLPIDFKNKCNVGYTFLNFRTEAACMRFAAEYHNADSSKKLPGFKSKKVCEVSPARCQGREENVRRLQGSPVMAELVGKPEWLPMVFNEQGESEGFPVPADAADAAAASARTPWSGRLARGGARGRVTA
mmetsp:Transcript_60973/g.132231  ORF Transcript_60973/g.132231 Transcript_60973/m.132231 type:complete len:351 (+) Transcript_60973:109-1161(+)